MALRVRISRPLSRSQTLSVLSSDPETAGRPSGVIATALTEPEWPSRVRITLPLSRSQTLSVLSSDPETAYLPSGVRRRLTPRHGPLKFLLMVHLAE